MEGVGRRVRRRCDGEKEVVVASEEGAKGERNEAGAAAMNDGWIEIIVGREWGGGRELQDVMVEVGENRVR